MRRLTPRVIGIAGGSGTGKTTVADLLRRRYPSRLSVVHLDDFYYHLRAIPKRYGRLNYDHPQAIDHRRLARVVRGLKRGRDQSFLSYRQSRTNDKPVLHRVKLNLRARPLIVVEGFAVLCFPKLRRLLDEAVYLESTEPIRLRRRSKPQQDAWYLDHLLRPMHRRYIQPSKRFADTVIQVDRLRPGAVVERIARRLDLAG